MSLQATQWALTVPPKVVPDGAWRLLVHLSDYADPTGDKVFPGNPTLARAMYCSERTIERHLAALKAAGLITDGDQRYTAHQRPDRRHHVWKLNLAWRPADVDDEPVDDEDSRGDSSDTPVDNPVGRGDSSVTPSSVDNSSGVTAAVAHGVTAVVATKELRKNHQENHHQRAREARVIHKDHDSAYRALVQAIERVARPGDIEALMDLAYEVGRGEPWIGYQMIRHELDSLPPVVHSLPALLQHRLTS